MIEATTEMYRVFENVGDIPAGVDAVIAIIERDYTIKPRTIRLTDPQLELFTDIARNPQMYLKRWSRWARTGSVLVRLGLAKTDGHGQDDIEITITESGIREAVRRGLIPDPGADTQEAGRG